MKVIKNSKSSVANVTDASSSESSFWWLAPLCFSVCNFDVSIASLVDADVVKVIITSPFSSSLSEKDDDDDTGRIRAPPKGKRKPSAKKEDEVLALWMTDVNNKSIAIVNGIIIGSSKWWWWRWRLWLYWRLAAEFINTFYLFI